MTARFSLRTSYGRPASYLFWALVMSFAMALPATAAGPYPPPREEPRVGTRILNFFKDLAYGTNPNDRYRRSAPPRPITRERRYEAQSGNERYSLDAPPPMTPQLRGPVPPQGPAAPPVPLQTRNRIGDAPFQPREAVNETAPDDFPQAGIGGLREDLPPVTIKSKNGEPSEKRVKVSNDPSEAPAQRTPPAPTRKPLPKTKPTDPSADSAPHTPAPSITRRPEPERTAAPTQSTTQTNLAQNPNRPESAPTTERGSATPVGKRTSQGSVLSPYPPYRELDVTGLQSGTLANDPTTGKIFRVP
ncbi:MAG: hypothetical protein ACOYMN_07785 [Roseimicrobium sp.]